VGGQGSVGHRNRLLVQGSARRPRASYDARGRVPLLPRCLRWVALLPTYILRPQDKDIGLLRVDW